jgi:hypothetical protein
MEKKVFFWTRSQSITSRAKSQAANVFLAPLNLYRDNPNSDFIDRVRISNVQARSISLAIGVIYQLADFTHDPFFNGANFAIICLGSYHHGN